MLFLFIFKNLLKLILNLKTQVNNCDPAKAYSELVLGINLPAGGPIPLVYNPKFHNLTPT